MPWPAGTSSSVKVPSDAECALTSGEPEACASHWSHETPGVKGATGALGT